MQKERVEFTTPPKWSEVKVTEMGHITEIQYMKKRNKHATIKVLDDDRFVVLSTGEIKDIEHHENRSDHKNSLLRTFARCRALINTNVTNVNNVRWITLTYAENMTDTLRLYKDFEKFNKRFQYYCKKQNYGKAEYIVMMEPQERGAWHCHLIYIWEHQAPFIPNSKLAEIWGHGFVKIKKLDDVDNVGAYLTAYLGDMEIDISKADANTKIVEIEEDGKKVKKAYVKGARLYLYPLNFNMLRHSKGIKEPISYYTNYDNAQKKVSGAAETYSCSFRLFDEETQTDNLISKQYFNAIRK